MDKHTRRQPALKHRVIILNRGSMFAFQWKEFYTQLSSAHRLLQCYHRQKRDRRRCNSRRIPHSPMTLRPLVNECAVSSDASRSDVAHSGWENLLQFLPILLWRDALSSSIIYMTLCNEVSLVKSSLLSPKKLRTWKIVS